MLKLSIPDTGTLVLLLLLILVCAGFLFLGFWLGSGGD